MNRKQAFAELIKRRNWYINMKISPKTATTHKKRFIEGKNVSEEFMCRALLAAGYKIQEEESWNSPYSLKNRIINLVKTDNDRCNCVRLHSDHELRINECNICHLKCR